jgi:UDP-N-acetylmuramate: L-alanyl-gamma-D-glutamyl-meso-diaminopimelate ligase
MKIYILGICGTFMAGIAMLARELDYQVVGSDANVYPPMSTQLQQAGIELREGYRDDNLDRDADLYVVGNAISRGNEQIEIILNETLPYISGPQWLYEHLLRERWVLAVAGTHGKTTTSSMLAWILDYAGMNPGFLIGGMTQNFDSSARLGQAPFFVIEADEYDTAFFDKRSKFVHYHPRTLVLNNLEFDHADIFDNLDAIKRQFHHLLRIVPANGMVIYNRQEPNLQDVLDLGCWSETGSFGIGDADLALDSQNNRIIDHRYRRDYVDALQQDGIFNQLNACAALLAAQHAGVSIEAGIEALHKFNGVKRRQEILATINGITIIDDFAHHPTAIQLTLEALRKKQEDSGTGRLIAVFEPRSNTMKKGVHKDRLLQAFQAANLVMLYDNKLLEWDPYSLLDSSPDRLRVIDNIDDMVQQLQNLCTTGDQVVIMSNGGFGGLHKKLIDTLTAS